MSNPDDIKEAATLTAALLARKGSAAPAGFKLRTGDGGAAKAVSGRSRAADGACNRNDVPRAGVLMRRDDMARRGDMARRDDVARRGSAPGDGHSCDGNGPGGSDDPGTPADRARVTLRLDEARHLQLKLAAAHTQQSLQEILTTALDRYLNDVAPEMLRDDCVCLAAARAQNTEDRS